MLVAGKYRVDRRIGHGGMGVVVAATHLGTGRTVALKFMRTPEGRAGDRERFLREGRAASALRGRNVCQVLDAAALEDGTPYLVMEFVDGHDLGCELAGRGRLPVGEAVGHALQVCEAMAEAHALGIIHRDLKPANLLVTRGLDGAPVIKVVDFGISKILGEGADGATTGGMGSPAYMAPEQARRGRTVDASADVYAIGAVLYHLVTGRPPFVAEEPVQILLEVQSGMLVPPRRLRPELPRAVERIVVRCLDRRPERRFRDAGELGLALREATSPAVTARVSGRSRRAAVLIAGAAVLGAIYLLSRERAGAAPRSGPVRALSGPATLSDAPPRPPMAAPVASPATVPAIAPVPSPAASPARAAMARIRRAPGDPPAAPAPAAAPAVTTRGADPVAAPGPVAAQPRCRTDDFLCQFGGER